MLCGQGIFSVQTVARCLCQAHLVSVPLDVTRALRSAHTNEL